MHYGFTLAGRGPFAQTDALSTMAKHGEALGFDSLECASGCHQAMAFEEKDQPCAQ